MTMVHEQINIENADMLAANPRCTLMLKPLARMSGEERAAIRKHAAVLAEGLDRL